MLEVGTFLQPPTRPRRAARARSGLQGSADVPASRADPQRARNGSAHCHRGCQRGQRGSSWEHHGGALGPGGRQALIRWRLEGQLEGRGLLADQHLYRIPEVRQRSTHRRTPAPPGKQTAYGTCRRWCGCLEAGGKVYSSPRTSTSSPRPALDLAGVWTADGPLDGKAWAT